MIGRNDTKVIKYAEVFILASLLDKWIKVLSLTRSTNIFDSKICIVNDYVIIVKVAIDKQFEVKAHELAKEPMIIYSSITSGHIIRNEHRNMIHSFKF